MTVTADRSDHNIYDAKFKNIKFSLGAARLVVVDASTEANLPGLAEMYLGDQSLWWILLDFNGLVDPIQDIRSGARLLIPERRTVIAFLEAREASSVAEVEDI
jgi:hypothetical protein